MMLFMWFRTVSFVIVKADALGDRIGGECWVAFAEFKNTI